MDYEERKVRAIKKLETNSQLIKQTKNGIKSLT